MNSRVPPEQCERKTPHSASPEPRVALGISRLVKRHGIKQRKALFVCGDTGMIIEKLVLRRWRKRRGQRGETFDGFRLRPHTWDIILGCLGNQFTLDPGTTPEALQLAIAKEQKRHPTWRATRAEQLLPLLRFLQGRGLLAKVVSRPRDPEKPGLPDLVLYRRRRDGTPYGFIFAEVKCDGPGNKKEERRRTQREELDFLRCLGLKAGFVPMLVCD